MSLSGHFPRTDSSVFSLARQLAFRLFVLVELSSQYWLWMSLSLSITAPSREEKIQRGPEVSQASSNAEGGAVRLAGKCCTDPGTVAWHPRGRKDYEELA